LNENNDFPYWRTPPSDVDPSVIGDTGCCELSELAG